MIGQIYATTKLRRQLQNRNGKYDGFTKKGSFYNSELSIDCYMAQHISRKSISSLHHKSDLDLGFGLFCQNQAKSKIAETSVLSSCPQTDIFLKSQV